MLISTSQDVLHIVLAFCALWLTLFLTWFLFYVIVMMRDIERMVRAVRQAFDKVDHLAHVVHEKVENSAASFTLISQAAKELVIWMLQERRSSVPAKKSSKAKKEE